MFKPFFFRVVAGTAAYIGVDSKCQKLFIKSQYKNYCNPVPLLYKMTGVELLS